MTSLTHSELELDSAMTHVCYELVAVAECAELLASGDLAIRNAALEAQLVHVRALAAFLLDEPRYADDIRRTDFDPEDCWQPAPSNSAQRLRDNQRVINKHLAHLTWLRVTEGSEAWSYPEMAEDMLGLAASWASHLQGVGTPHARRLSAAVSQARRMIVPDPPNVQTI